LKLLNIAGKQYSKEGMIFRFSKEEGRFEFVFEEEGLKTKLEAKRESLLGKRVKPNHSEGSCAFEVKQAMFKKEDTKESVQKGAPVWSNGKQVNEQNVVIWLKDKEQLKPLLESPFMEGLFDATAPSTVTEQPKAVEAVGVGTMQESVEIE
jgi:hypothetical protein